MQYPARGGGFPCGRIHFGSCGIVTHLILLHIDERDRVTPFTIHQRWEIHATFWRYRPNRRASHVFDERDTVVWLWCRFPFWSAVGMMGNNGAERAWLVWWIHRARERGGNGARRRWIAEERQRERDCGGDSGDAVLSKWRIVNAKHIGWYGTGWDGDHIPLQTPFGQQNINVIELHGPPYLRSVIN